MLNHTVLFISRENRIGSSLCPITSKQQVARVATTKIEMCLLQYMEVHLILRNSFNKDIYFHIDDNTYSYTLMMKVIFHLIKPYGRYICP